MLDAQHVEKIRHLLVSAGWRDVVKPAIEARKQQAERLANALPTERPKPYSELDDHTATSVLRGEKRALEWVLNVFQNEVTVADFNRKAREELTHEPANPA